MRIVVIVVRIQAGGRDEDEASTGAGGVSRAVRIVKIQAGGRDEDEALTGAGQAGARRRATTSDDRRWWCEPGGEERGEDTGEGRGGEQCRCAARHRYHKQ